MSSVCYPTCDLWPGAIVTGTESKALRRFSSQHGALVAQRQDLRLEKPRIAVPKSFFSRLFAGLTIGAVDIAGTQRGSFQIAEVVE